jgi:hypothetical protein
MDFITDVGNEAGAFRESHKDKVIGADLPPLAAHQGAPHRSGAPDRDFIGQIYVMLFGEIN